MIVSRILVGTLIAVASVFLATNTAVANKGGTSILHLTVDVTMQTTGADADAAGSAFADIKRQGKAEKQSLGIEVTNLESNVTYKLLAAIGSDTNLTEVLEFQTDANGAAVLKYSKKGQGKGKDGTALPSALDPVSAVRELAVADALDQVVLTADFTSPDKLQYLVKRALDNDGTDLDATGSLRIKSNGVNDQLRVRAQGLDALATYHLTINGMPASSATADDKGRLDLKGLPEGSPPILDVTDIAVWDSLSNSVLSTSLP